MEATDVKEIEKEVKHDIEVFTTDATVVKIEDQVSFEYVSDLVLKGKKLLKEIDAKVLPVVQAAHEAHKQAKDLQNALKRPLEARISVWNDQVSKYLSDQEKARREAEKQAEEERQKKIKEAEDLKKAEAQKAAEAGDKEKAEKLIEESKNIEILPEVVAPAVEKTTRIDGGVVSGISDVEITVIDKKAFILKAIEFGLLDDFIVINEGAVKRYIKTTKTETFAGLKIEEKIRASYRGR
jgi:hypothetical protein